ncbi:dihydropteroate synthase [Propionibacteriaceae bacterium G57]|uniref:dihydropteroate synthase n=1 Tax=Aestuariimicrobium sp. G57 TaxID=3418485 RepID=UPI003DA758EF
MTSAPLPLVMPVIDVPVRRIGARTFDFSRQAAVMAVVNRTPDSFHDRGATFALDKAVDACLAAADLGADWVDIGGVPFSPLTPDISADEEAERVLPVVEAITSRSDVVVSVDTTRASVAAAAVAAGAGVINDTSCLSDPGMAGVIARSGASVVITHSLAAPHQWLDHPHYDDVTGQVRDTLASRVADALAAGVRADQVLVDPGHDLNKNTHDTLQVTRELGTLAMLGHPVLAAVSNKDFIGETLDRPRGERVPGSLAAAMWCLMAGARVLRMHDVAASVDVVRMFEAIMGWREPVRMLHNV